MQDRDQPSDPSFKPTSVAFLLVGGYHHFLHIVPAAAELALDPSVRVIAYVNHNTDATQLKIMLAELDGGPVNIRIMHLPRLIERMGALGGYSDQLKVPRLLAWMGALRSHDAIVTAERTSTLLKRLPGKCPQMLHLPHGFGDRAKGFDWRHIFFDHILVAGNGIKERMVRQGLAPADKIDVCGSIKLAAVNRIRAARQQRLFENDRPTILYNPHFDRTLSSWAMADGLIETVVADGRFNLVVAPHVRLFETATNDEKNVWQQRAVADRVIVDLDSPRLMDMSYTMGSDIYVGDVSSQVYEFLYRPRPCLFLNAHDVAWQEDPSYSCWHFGHVCNAVSQLSLELDRLFVDHKLYIDAQRKGVAETLGNTGDAAPRIAARQLIDAIRS